MSRSLRIRLRVLGLVLSGLIAGALAVQLVVAPGLFRSAHPLPLVAVFLVLAAVSVATAVYLWRDADPPT